MLGVSNVSKLHFITFVVQYHGGFLAIITYQCNDDMCIWDPKFETPNIIPILMKVGMDPKHLVQLPRLEHS